MAHSTNLATLRRRRLYIHKQLDRVEPWVARLLADLAEAEAGIASKMARGTFSATFLLASLAVLALEGINLQDL